MKHFKEHRGNLEILNQGKTAFLCSRKISAGAVLRCYDWAIEQREAGKCIISGFHSPLEKDVFHYLQKGTQPIIRALARGIPEKLDSETQSMIDKGRLLIISPFTKSVIRASHQTALLRNRMMIDLADEIVVGYEDLSGSIASIIIGCNKPLVHLFKNKHD